MDAILRKRDYYVAPHKVNARNVYTRAYRAARDGCPLCPDNPVFAAASDSLNARGARFNGDPGYKEIPANHFPVFQRQSYLAGLVALQRVEEKVKS